MVDHIVVGNWRNHMSKHIDDATQTKVGILGGTFNPIHHGHLMVANHARNVLGLDRVIFVPSGDPPHKSHASLAPVHQRVDMIHHAIDAIPYFTLSDVEYRTSQTSYTIDTVRNIRNTENGTLWFIIGIDAFVHIGEWRASDELLSSTNFLVLSRPPTKFASAACVTNMSPWAINSLHQMDDGICHRLDCHTGPHATLTFMSMPPCYISASSVRKCLRQRLSVAEWLPPEVHSYIINHRLYE